MASDVRRFGVLFALWMPFFAQAEESAHATDEASWFLSPGALLSVTTRSTQPVIIGAGVELSIINNVDRDVRGFGYGAFIQTQGTQSSFRAALGPQIHYAIFGLELGAAIEGGSKDFGTSLGAQIAPYLSIGILSVAFRTTLPVATLRGTQKYPVEYGTVISIKYPIALDGPSRLEF